MQLQLIRNATMRLTYSGHLLVTDPFLADKDSIRSFAGIAPNPIVGLPHSPEEVLADIELVIISHLHVDHFDPMAEELLPKELPIFCQPGDESELRGKGFQNVRPIENEAIWQGITIKRTTGRHGTGDLAEQMGQVSGFVLQAEKEPTVYWAGDTVLYEPVKAIIDEVRPDVIITHSSGARFGDSDPIVMGAEQTIAVCQAAPWATVVAVHLESLDHGTVSRADLRALAGRKGIGQKHLLIPEDGESLSL